MSFRIIHRHPQTHLNSITHSQIVMSYNDGETLIQTYTFPQLAHGALRHMLQVVATQLSDPSTGMNGSSPLNGWNTVLFEDIKQRPQRVSYLNGMEFSRPA